MENVINIIEIVQDFVQVAYPFRVRCFNMIQATKKKLS